MSEPTVLVADDEIGLRESVERTLRREGFRVLQAEDGQAALDALRQSGVDLLLADLRMPGLDGLELLRAAKLLTPEVEVIVLSGHGTVQEAVQAMKEGAYDFLTKPLERAHLVRAVRLSSGIERAVERGEGVPVFSPTATRATVEMMTAVVDEVLEKGKAKIPTMSVAAKTGTAQLTAPGGGYYTDRFFHSFVGFFPSYSPRFIILLYTNDPQGVQYASETLDATFLDLVHFLIDYYAVPPDRGLPTL